MIRSCLLITLIKCLKGHKSLGSLCSVVKTLIVSGAGQTDRQTRCPIELFWTAKKISTFLLPFWSFKSGWARCVGPRGKSPNKYQFIFSPDFSPTDFLPIEIFFSREGCTAFAKDFNLLVDFLNFCLSPFQRNKKREVKNSQNYQGIRLTTSRLPIREQS